MYNLHMTCWLYNTCVLETISNLPPCQSWTTNILFYRPPCYISSLLLNTCIKTKLYIQASALNWFHHHGFIGAEVYVTIWYWISENNVKSLNTSLIWSRWAFCCSVSQLLWRVHDQIDIILPGLSVTNTFFEFLSAHASFINDNI